MTSLRKIGLLILLLCLCSVSALADYTPDPRYTEADELLRQSRYVKAREIAESMLAENPGSFEAQCLLGRVHLHGEGNPGKADYYLRKSRKAIKRKFSQPSTAEGPWHCYSEVLWALRMAAMDLENYPQAIDWITEYNEAYPHAAAPDLYGWPLMKMGRMEEARQKMGEAKSEVKDGDLMAMGSILNTMGAVEYEAGNFEESLTHFKEIIRLVERSNGEMDPVYFSNAAEASRGLLDYPEVEKYLLQSTKHLHRNSYSTPWLDLSELYLAQGRQPEAIQALERHSRHLSRCEASIQNQKRAYSQLVLGMALLACGYDDEASGMLEKVALHGDRNSGTSTKRSLTRSRNNFFYREALKQKRERLRERRSYAPWSRWGSLVLEEFALDREMESARRECAALALESDGPAAMITPFGPNGFNCPWLTPALGEVFGSGVISEESAEVLDTVKGTPAEPYVMAILAEARGDEEMMDRCLELLPATQVLLRGRLHALKARAGGAAESFQQALESDPPVLRRLSMALPVAVSGSDTTLTKTILSSPRFSKGEGFQLAYSGSGEDGFSGSLQGPDGSVLSRFESPAGETASESRQLFCEKLHQTVFAPRVNLTQSDINGLDGSNQAGGQFREQLKGIMGGNEPDKAAP